MAKVTVKNLTVAYKTRKGGVTALDGADAVFESGLFNVILGYSGCGKTTLLRTVAGLQEYQGEILYDDTDTDELNFAMRNLSYVTQDYSLYYHMTVFDNIAFALNVSGAPKDEVIKRVNDIADEFRLSFCLSRKPKQLSGGQQQCVAIAKALIKNPSLCLLDEPLSNIDAPKRAQIRILIKQALKRRGCTVLYVTHDFTEAMSLADKIFIMDKGRFVQSGTPEEIYASENPIVKSLKGASTGD